MSEEIIDKKDGIAVYCKCGGIVWAVTNHGYERDKQLRKEFDELFSRGFSVAKVSKDEVQKLWGCKCPEIKINHELGR